MGTLAKNECASINLGDLRSRDVWEVVREKFIQRNSLKRHLDFLFVYFGFHLNEGYNEQMQEK